MVEGKGYSLRGLRSIQDWFAPLPAQRSPWVADVASVGGVYQIDLDANRLRAYKIPLSAVVDAAVMRSNRNVGGNVVEAAGTWSVVRGLGLIEDVSPSKVTCAATVGTPWDRRPSVGGRQSIQQIQPAQRAKPVGYRPQT